MTRHGRVLVEYLAELLRLDTFGNLPVVLDVLVAQTDDADSILSSCLLIVAELDAQKGPTYAEICSRRPVAAGPADRSLRQGIFPARHHTGRHR